MPRHSESKTAATNGETPRGAVSKQRAGDIRMGKPASGHTLARYGESIAIEETDPGN